jgi:hypothetical protein
MEIREALKRLPPHEHLAIVASLAIGFGQATESVLAELEDSQRSLAVVRQTAAKYERDNDRLVHERVGLERRIIQLRRRCGLVGIPAPRRPKARAKK